jgi:hypothetical protein
MASPSKRAGDESPLETRRRRNFNPLELRWSVTRVPWSPLGDTAEAERPALVESNAVVIRTNNQT